MVGRNKKIGHDKCPHINKKTGHSDCVKIGRYSPKPIVSWNTKFDKNGRKRAYIQFIHNDGTRHNIETVEQHWLRQIKGHPLEKFLIRLNTLSNVGYCLSNFIGKIAEASLRWPNREEDESLIKRAKEGDFGPLIRKYDRYEHERRQQIYKNSQDAKEEYGPIEFQKLDTTARHILFAKNDAEMKNILHQLTPEQAPLVIQRCLELEKADLRRRDDYLDMILEMAREKGGGKLPPELERKLVIARHKN